MRSDRPSVGVPYARSALCTPLRLLLTVRTAAPSDPAVPSQFRLMCSSLNTGETRGGRLPMAVRKDRPWGSEAARSVRVGYRVITKPCNLSSAMNTPTIWPASLMPRGLTRIAPWSRLSKVVNVPVAVRTNPWS